MNIRVYQLPYYKTKFFEGKTVDFKFVLKYLDNLIGLYETIMYFSYILEQLFHHEIYSALKLYISISFPETIFIHIKIY